MKFNRYPYLEGKHSFLSASNYHWVNYDDEKLDRVFLNSIAARRGTELHALAHMAIRLGVKLKGTNQTLPAYVNDAIGFRMTPEQILFYSENCFGTADAISFRGNKLRIHDLKTGETKTSMIQLMVYAAIFCLEYGHLPTQIEIELRIYQNDEVDVLIPEVDDIVHIMDRIVTFDKRIKQIREEDEAA